jgi:hypothetical protein
VENYGTDLFVGWITRFEPIPTSLLPLMWLILLIIISFGLIATTNNVIAIIPVGLWFIYYCGIPFLIRKWNILPKKANGRFLIIMLIMFYPWTLIILFFVWLLDWIFFNKNDKTINRGF